MGVSRDILFFAGQGTNTHFSDNDKTAIWLGCLSSDAEKLWTKFLAKSKLAFEELYQGLSEDERSILPEDTLAACSTPYAFLHPPVAFQSHPVFQTTALFVRQLLELLVYQSHHGESSVVAEAAGVCTGLLPAVLASAFTSYFSAEFCAAAVNTFKISFWIGLRASLRCRSVVGSDWNAHPCVLSVFKLQPHVVEEHLRKYNATLATSDTPLRLSAVFDDDSVSVAGPGRNLDTFRSTLHALPDPGICRWAHVHGLYHGGHAMKDVAEQVMADIRGIDFPDSASLNAPVRSTATGQIFRPDSGNGSLLRQAVENIFVESVDWKLTWETITQTYTEKAGRDTNAVFRVIGLGPSAKGLLSLSKVNDSGLQVIGQLPDDMNPCAEDDIAIVGLSANFPGERGVDGFWNVVNEARTCVSEIPESRFSISDYYQTDTRGSNKPRKMSSKHGNFLDDPFSFDAGYFNISPREAKSMDPQQRLLLHAAVEALDDAGYSPGATSSFQQGSFGVYVGVATGDYVDNLRRDIDVYYSPGTLRAFLSGRISYAFGFKGPSMVIDTACSSSMVSIYHACEALRSGDCTAALAGGVNVISSPDMYLGLSRAHFLSPTGQCKPFDAGADGYCRAEGCGLVVLKKLCQARAEGDHIYGVIRGVGVNQCGTAKSITHPDHETQAALFSKTLGLSRLSPDSIDVVEAHGTGTQAGDFAELSSLSAVFAGRSDQNPLHLCSVKGNIGHAEAASGVAGLIKLLLMMRHESIPRQGSFRTLNPRLESMVAKHNFVVADSPRRWLATHSRPRRALLNNFGAAGSNAALVLEEAPRDIRGTAKPMARRSRHFLTISARSAKALERLKAAYASCLTANPMYAIEDICYTATVRRRHYKEFRWSAAVTDAKDALSQIRRAEPAPQRIVPAKSKVVFVFSGQGGAHQGMGAELLQTSPVFRAAVEECDAILRLQGFPVVKPYLEPAPSEEEAALVSERDSILIVQCACFVLEYALMRFLQSLGLTPDVVLGHSIGEYAALVTAEALQLRDALLFVAKRAELMYRHCKAGASGMLACRMAPSDAATFLQNHLFDTAEALGVACHNSPEDCVVAGPTSRLVELAARFKVQGIRHKILNVAYGFHSSAMDTILPGLHQAASTMAVSPPTIQVGSSVLGRLLDGHGDLSSDYFVAQTRQPVLFMEVLGDIQSNYAQTNLQVIEIGPSTSASSMFKAAFAQGTYSYSPTLRPSEPSWATITALLHSLYQSGQDLSWAGVYKDELPRYLKQLPCQQLEGQQYVVPYREPMPADKIIEEQKPDTASAPFDLLSSSVMSSCEGGSTRFRVSVDNFSHLIKAHAVGGVPLCPASVYVELALEAISVTQPISSAQKWYSVDGINFEHPLVYSETRSDLVDIEIRSTEETSTPESAKFSISSKEHDHLYCSGSVSATIGKSIEELLTLKTAYVSRQRSLSFDLGTSRALETFTSRTLYDVIFPRVVSYSEPFRTLKHLTISSLGLEGYGIFCLPDAQPGQFVCPPPFVDTMLHAAGFIANAKADLETACICVSLGRMVLPDLSRFPSSGELGIYCSLLDVDDSTLADAFVLDHNGKVISFAEGMRFKKIRLRSFKTVLSRASQTTSHAVSSSLPKRVQDSLNRPKEQAVSRPRAVSLPTPSDSTTEVVKETIQSVCGVSWEPSSGRTLAELGIDSLLFIELTQSIASRFPSLVVAKDEIEKCQTVDDLVHLINKAQGHDGVATSLSPPPMPSSGHTLPMENKLPSPPTERVECDISSEIQDLFAELCGTSITPDNRDASLASLGVDSLLSIELVHEIRQRFGLSLDTLQSSISEMSINNIEALYSTSVSSSDSGVTSSTSTSMQTSLFDGSSDDSELTKPADSAEAHGQSCSSILSHLIPSTFPHIIQARDSGTATTPPALYLIHDGSGLSNAYTRLKPLGRPAKGIFSLDIPSIDPSIQSMQNLASLYIQRGDFMSQTAPIICGWSFGGVLALEITRQLRQRGKPAGGLVLIDSPSPIDHEPLPAEVISHVVSSSQPEHRGSGAAAKARSCIEAQFRRHAGLLQRYNPQPEEDDVRCVFLLCRQTMDTEALCGVAYPWLADDGFRRESVRSWEGLLGQSISVLELDCNHFDVFEPSNVDEVSAKLRRACEMLDPAV